MTSSTTTTTTINHQQPAPQPSPPPLPQRSDMSPLTAILSLLVLVAIPTLIYAVFFALKCPRNPFRRRDRSSTSVQKAGESSRNLYSEFISSINYSKEEGKGSSECPICLSVFVDGEEIKQLNGCKHCFHDNCINTWLQSRSNCPVCRGYVPVKRAKRPVALRDEDIRQGLPDAASLV